MYTYTASSVSIPVVDDPQGNTELLFHIFTDILWEEVSVIVPVIVPDGVPDSWGNRNNRHQTLSVCMFQHMTPLFPIPQIVRNFEAKETGRSKATEAYSAHQ